MGIAGKARSNGGHGLLTGLINLRVRVLNIATEVVDAGDIEWGRARHKRRGHSVLREKKHLGSPRRRELRRDTLCEGGEVFSAGIGAETLGRRVHPEV